MNGRHDPCKVMLPNYKRCTGYNMRGNNLLDNKTIDYKGEREKKKNAQTPIFDIQKHCSTRPLPYSTTKKGCAQKGRRRRIERKKKYPDRTTFSPCSSHTTKIPVDSVYYHSIQYQPIKTFRSTYRGLYCQKEFTPDSMIGWIDTYLR